MKKIKNIISAVLLMVCLMTTSSNAFAATWRTGDCTSSMSTYKYCATVDLVNKSKTGYIKFHTYSCVKGTGHTGSCPSYPLAGETSGKVSLKFTTTSGKWLCEFDTTGGTKLKLGSDNSAYKIYHHLKKMNSADNFINSGKCTHWAIETISNTSIR